MKKMKSIMVRLFAVYLTVAMVLSMTVLGAFAETVTSVEQKGTITVKGTINDEEATVCLYRLMNVNMASVGTNEVQLEDPMFTWVNDVANWLKNEENGYKNLIDTEDNSVTDAYAQMSADKLRTFLSDLYSGLKDVDTWTAAYEGTIGDGEDNTIKGSAIFKDVNMGQYLVIATKESNEYNPAIANLYPKWKDGSGWTLDAVTVALKGNNATIDKEVDDANVSIGDVVSYSLKASVPVYPPDATATKFNVGDTMSSGLTWNKDSLNVYWSVDGTTVDTKNKVDDSCYSVVTDDIKGATFEVQFKYDELTKAYENAKYVYVVYTATINQNAFTVDDLGNTAYVGVNTDPYDEKAYDENTDKEQVYTYGITVTKVGEDGELLPDVEFKLYSDKACTNEIKFVAKGNGVYTKATEEQISAGTDIATTLVTNEKGQFQLQGLACDTYYLKETKAADGYLLPADATLIELKDSDENGQLDKESTISGSSVGKQISPMAVGGSEEFVEGDHILSVTIVNNKPGFNLPTTGGMGTVLFTAGGLVIMACGAALVLVTLKKKKAED